MFRIAITGPESTGKSTLAAQLAAALGCLWRKEAAREYLNNLGRPYAEADLYAIHLQQQAEEKSLLLQSPKLLVLDTEETVLRIWSEEKYGRCDLRILQSISINRPDLYLLTGVDMPWEPDPLREHPDPKDRLWLWKMYHEAMVYSGVVWTVVEGSGKARLGSALRAVKEHAGFPVLNL